MVAQFNLLKASSECINRNLLIDILRNEYSSFKLTSNMRPAKWVFYIACFISIVREFLHKVAFITCKEVNSTRRNGK